MELHQSLRLAKNSRAPRINHLTCQRGIAPRSARWVHRDRLRKISEREPEQSFYQLGGSVGKTNKLFTKSHSVAVASCCRCQHRNRTNKHTQKKKKKKKPETSNK